MCQCYLHRHRCSYFNNHIELVLMEYLVLGKNTIFVDDNSEVHCNCNSQSAHVHLRWCFLFHWLPIVMEFREGRYSLCSNHILVGVIHYIPK